MDPAQTRTRPQPALTFEDGFGRRQQVVSGTKDPVQVLMLKREHLAVPGFEAAVRERIDQVAPFPHDSFARIRGLARLAKAETGLALVSDVVDGTRLSQMLESNPGALASGGALTLVGQLMDALVAFHTAVKGCHGSLAPERLLLKADGRLVITDHVFGSAVPKLTLSPEAYWQQLQIAVPPESTPAFDQRTDVFQAGSVALALLVGRPLGTGYPNRLGTADAASALSISAALELVPKDAAAWLGRALQRRGSEPFASIEDARDAFATVLAGVDRVAARSAVLAFHSGQGAAAAPKPKAAAPTPASPALTASPSSAPTIVAAPAKKPAAPPVPAPAPSPMFQTPGDDDADDEGIVAGAFASAVNPVRRFLVPMTRRTIAVAAGILILLTTGGAFAAKRYFTTAPPVAKGTLAVTTTPAGANVVIDGQQRGHAPMTVALPAGEHVLQVALDGSSRTIPIKVNPGTEVSQLIDLPKVVVPNGQVQVRTEPSGARVLIDGQKRGTSPLTVADLTPGVHLVTVEGQQGTATQDVTVQSGATASLVIPLNAPESAAPASGWIAVNAPVDVQLFEKGQLLGGRSDKIVASVGKHDLEIINDAVGYRTTKTVTVNAGATTTVKVDPPKGSISLNALPWAEVFIDGERAGETPIGNVQIALGQHEIVFRHPELGERRFTPTVTLNAPVRLSADFRRTP